MPGALHILLQEGYIRTCRLHFVTFEIGMSALELRFSHGQRSLGLPQAWKQIVLVQFA